MTMKLALPLASPHCRLRCWVLPAIWRGLPWAPWTTPSKGFKGPHWARYCHHTENPMQVTEAPVSTRPRTGMPSRLSWPVMGGPTVHPTGVTLASGDPSNSLTARWGWSGSRLLERLAASRSLSSWRAMGTGTCLLAKKALEDGACRTVRRYSVLLPRRGSSVGVDDPSRRRKTGDRIQAPPRNPGRCGERGRQEAAWAAAATVAAVGAGMSGHGGRRLGPRLL